MGIGGGVVLVPAMVYLLHLSQHTAQGTSLFCSCRRWALGALLMYWKKGQVDLRAGLICALDSAGRIFREQDGDWPFLEGFARIVWLVFDRDGGVVVAQARASEVAGGDCGMSLHAAFCPVDGLGVGWWAVYLDRRRALLCLCWCLYLGSSNIARRAPAWSRWFLRPDCWRSSITRSREVDWTVGLLIMPGVFFGAMAGTIWRRSFPRTDCAARAWCSRSDCGKCLRYGENEIGTSLPIVRRSRFEYLDFQS